MSRRSIKHLPHSPKCITLCHFMDGLSFPPSVTNLEAGHNLPQVPPHLTHLSFSPGYKFHPDILKLPPTLTFLKIHNVKLKSLPPSITHLEAQCIIRSKRSTLLPPNLTHLKFGDTEIELQSFPTTLTHLFITATPNFPSLSVRLISIH
jgi:hypothetical protein